MTGTESPPKRFYDLDALRAVAMLLGIVLHSSVFVRPEAQPLWPVHDSTASAFRNVVEPVTNEPGSGGQEEFGGLTVLRLPARYQVPGVRFGILGKQFENGRRRRMQRVTFSSVVDWRCQYRLCASVGIISQRDTAQPRFEQRHLRGQTRAGSARHCHQSRPQPAHGWRTVLRYLAEMVQPAEPNGDRWKWRWRRTTFEIWPVIVHPRHE